jgi:hypothetical protein
MVTFFIRTSHLAPFSSPNGVWPHFTLRIGLETGSWSPRGSYTKICNFLILEKKKKKKKRKKEDIDNIIRT